MEQSTPRRAVSLIAVIVPLLCAAFSEAARPHVKLGGRTYDLGAVGVGAAAPEDAVTLIGDGALVAWNRGGKPAATAKDRSAEEVAALPKEVEVPVAGGDLSTRTDSGDCRLHVEWLSPPGGLGQHGGNSGVLLQGRYELQVLNTPAPGDAAGDNLAGAIYGVKAPDVNAAAGAGQWQSYDVWFRAPRFQDGKKTQPARITAMWNGVSVHSDVAVDAPTGAKKSGEEPRPAGDYQVGPLTLQAHPSDAEGPVRFRNVWVAPLDEPAADWGEWRPLFDGKTLAGWTPLGGKATFAIEGDQIVGTTAPDSPNTFLTTADDYGDFDLELELKADDGLNSGVQVRSATTDGTRGRDARVTGYQAEVDHTPARSWSGGLYDEGGRLWLVPLTDDPAARAAYKFGEWNQYRILCRGAVIRVFVNGVPTAAAFDALRTSGLIGLQVHGVGDRVDPLHVRWRNLRIRTPR